MIKILHNGCLYAAVGNACQALNRTLDEAARQELVEIIEKAGTFPPDKVRELPRILSSIGLLRVYGAEGPEQFSANEGDGIIIVRRIAEGRDEGHAEFGFADELRLEGEICWMIVFERHSPPKQGDLVYTTESP